MATYKLLALDVDGTLLSSRHHLPRRTARAVKRAIESGFLVTLATGRPYQMALPVARALGISLPLVVADGASGIDPQTGRRLWHEPIPAALTLALVRELEHYDLAIHLLLETMNLGNRRLRVGWRTLLRGHPRALPLTWAGLRSYPRWVEPKLSQYLAANPVAAPKLWVAGPAAELQAARRAVQARFGEEIRFAPSGDLTRGGVSKASGLGRLAAHLGLAPAEVMAVGDHFNDYEMLAFVGCGIAMGNAPPEVKAQARFVTGTSDEYGVAQVIEQFVLKR